MAHTQQNAESAMAHDVIWEKQHGPRRRARVTKNQVAGRTKIHIRLWYVAPSGEWEPGREGVSFFPEEIPQVVQGLMLAAKGGI
ncbi:transcriptional coactivator p15/PC4 family protein [Burkholderia cepacia]|uniref:transcriptional coactivator p15/PC4 family protein n=1 Tax=Burkholderia cepacia TaxID=292 RepID=UPI00158CB9BD|nr:transcriptional coactivator p15/PC4 family protein [Burkholderia cepacia]